MTDLDADKQLCRDYFSAFLRADEAWWAAHVSPDFVRHDPGLPFEVPCCPASRTWNCRSRMSSPKAARCWSAFASSARTAAR